eukprot:scaffold1295_cov33-Prasinocladus_malaysianus.AAC.1
MDPPAPSSIAPGVVQITLARVSCPSGISSACTRPTVQETPRLLYLKTRRRQKAYPYVSLKLELRTAPDWTVGSKLLQRASYYCLIFERETHIMYADVPRALCRLGFAWRQMMIIKYNGHCKLPRINGFGTDQHAPLPMSLKFRSRIRLDCFAANMGGVVSTKGGSSPQKQAKEVKKPHKWKPIPDRFSSLQEVQASLRRNGLESSNLILGIDFTK